MQIIFFILGGMALVSGALVVFQKHPLRSALWLIVNFFAVAGIYLLAHAEFIAAIQVIVYAGAIMVLFVFAIMMLGLTPESIQEEGRWFLSPRMLIGPAILAAILLGELIYILVATDGQAAGVRIVDPKQVGITLFGPYLLGVELASLLLLAGLVGAYHLGRKVPGQPSDRPGEER